MENQKQAAFTLSQLLAVLVIINIVAFFLQRANSLARSSYCTGNLKQVGLAILQYATDYDDRFPPGATATKNNNALLGWAATHDRYSGPISPETIASQTTFNQLIGGYLKTESILRCPEVPNNSGPVSYMYNDLAAGVSEADFAAIAHSVLMCDGEDFAGNVGHAYDPNAPAVPAAFAIDGTVLLGATMKTAPLRHSDGAQYVHADGHVRWSKPEAIYFPSRFSTSRSHKDAKTGKLLGPDPARLNTKQVSGYVGTFHVK